MLGSEREEYTTWSWLSPTHQHKTPFPRTNTESTQPQAAHCCGLQNFARSKGITGSVHSINRERMATTQATWRKGGLEIQTTEMPLISCECYSVNRELCTWWNTTKQSWYPILPPFTFSATQESRSEKLTSSWFRMSSLMHPQNSISFPITHLTKKKRQIEVIINTQAKGLLKDLP